MINLTLRIPLSPSYTANSNKDELSLVSTVQLWVHESVPQIQVFLVALALVILPVFVQAPLVRYFPWVSLGLTPAWLGLGWWLLQRPRWQLWGDMIIGFAWIWLTGSIYWGWFSLGTGCTFTYRSSRVAHCSPVSALQLGPGRQLLFSGVIAWHRSDRSLY